MKYTVLPNTNIKVSKLCLGTMTFGEQNSLKEGHKQLNYALEKGINFIDTAELYSVPAKLETYGVTEKIIGSWLKNTGNRDNVILATKIAGTGNYTAHIRTNGFSKSAIKQAVENSLKRLQTDYIDLYQLHWPERLSNYFGVRDYYHNPKDSWKENFQEVLESLNESVKEGKIRHYGISNEKAWGTMKFLETAAKNKLPKIKTIQNPYSLLCRTFEGDLAEISIRENIGLLAYSPMAFGTLSGKYLNGKAPKKSRLNLFAQFARYSSKQAKKATEKYLKIAQKHHLSLAQMSLAWVTQQPWVTSNIIGATTMKQLKENISSIDIELSNDILKEINEVHNTIPNPAP